MATTGTRAPLLLLATSSLAMLWALRKRRRPYMVKRCYEMVDEINARDPRVDAKSGLPQDLVYGLHMTQQLESFLPNSSDALKVAARAQHVGRHLVPRTQFPEGKLGYHQWRRHLYARHAETAVGIMRRVGGFNEEEMAIVNKILRKDDIKGDENVQAVEDVACLVFLRDTFSDFSAKHEDDKMVDILQKTWEKMSQRAKDAALKLEFNEASKELLKRALS